jgi:hypothetical protein
VQHHCALHQALQLSFVAWEVVPLQLQLRGLTEFNPRVTAKRCCCLCSLQRERYDI